MDWWRSRGSALLVVGLFMIGSLVLPSVSQAKTAQEIDASANAALARFEQEVKGSAKFLAESKGVLVLPVVRLAA